jgi:hypothetical protein
MATLTQVDKIAAKWFHDQMRRRGFAVEKKFIFWRKRGPLFDMIMSEILTGGIHLRVRLSIWSPWVDDPENGELGEFPPSYALVGGGLSEDFPARKMSGSLFSVETEQDIEESLRSLLQLIDEKALPWFPTVDSYEKYAAYVDARGFLATKERASAIKEGIARGFAKEPYI